MALPLAAAKNGQPWEVFVLTGPKLEALRDALTAALRENRTAPMHNVRRGHEAHRRAAELSQAMGEFIARQGWEPRSFIARCLRFFEAPAAVVVCSEGAPDGLTGLDIGAYMQTLALSAKAQGLDSCIIGYTLIVAPVIKEVLGLPENVSVVITLALGYADETQPMAQFRSERDPIENCVHFME